MPGARRSFQLCAAIAAVLAIVGCNHVAEEMEKGIEKAAGIPQQPPETEAAVIESYCYKGLGYGSGSDVVCYREPQEELEGRLMGSTYGRPAD